MLSSWNLLTDKSAAPTGWFRLSTSVAFVIGIIVVALVQIIYGNRSSLYVMIVVTVFCLVNWKLLKQLTFGDKTLEPDELRGLLAWVFASLTAIEIIQAFHSFGTHHTMGSLMACLVAALFANLCWKQIVTATDDSAANA